MSTTRTAAKVVGLAAAAVGLATAGVAAGAALRQKRASMARPELDSLDRLGSLRGPSETVLTEDGVALYAEVDDVNLPQPVRGRRRRRRTADPTVVYVHGYALNLRVWHFQRREMRGKVRQVFYDQRSHGRSGRSESSGCTAEQLGRDLLRVLDELVPTGPVLLVGHSMGGMTVLALAGQHPEIFGPRVVGVALLSSSAGDMHGITLGLPGYPGRLVQRLAPSAMAVLARAPGFVESGRRAGSALGFAVTRRVAFGGPVPASYVEFTDEMLAGTPIDVVADFFPIFNSYDAYAAVPALEGVPTLILCGTEDVVTPVRHTRAIADLLPTATLREIEGAGHMVLLESHHEVNQALAELVNPYLSHAQAAEA
jgi:pimeloyl-ACP methyl ester carboxylesterase